MTERGTETDVSGLAVDMDDMNLNFEGGNFSHDVGNGNDGDSGVSRESQNAKEDGKSDEDVNEDEEKDRDSSGVKDEEKEGDVGEDESSREDGNAEKTIYDENQLSYDDEDSDDSKILRKLTEIREDIRALYLSGTPLFTRQTLHDLPQSLKALPATYTREKKKFIYVKALNGAMVGFEFETGRLFISRPDREVVLGKPMIIYKSIQTLLRKEYLLPLRQAYCSLLVIHESILRDHITKEVFNNGILIRGEPLTEDMLKIFNTNRDQWERSEECRVLLSLINSIDSLNRIKQIVAFACSSFEDDRNRQHSRSSYQHALILTLRDALQSKAGKSKEVPGEELKEEELNRKLTTPCYAQDPAYNEADKAVLKTHGITVLDDPDGFLQVDKYTLVLSHSPNVPVKQVTMDLALPAAMIWNRIEEERGDGARRTDPDSSRLRGIIGKYYDVFEFPGCEENFGNVVLYVRRAGQVDMAKYGVLDSCP